MQVAFYLAGEITQVKESIPWVRCVSGNVCLFVGVEDICVLVIWVVRGVGIGPIWLELTQSQLQATPVTQHLVTS